MESWKKILKTEFQRLLEYMSGRPLFSFYHPVHLVVEWCDALDRRADVELSLFFRQAIAREIIPINLHHKQHTCRMQDLDHNFILTSL